MAAPYIVIVDDELQVVHAVERDLRRHYQSNYRTITATSGTEALSAVRRLQARNASIALFLVDQRMPEMTGVEFLEEVRKIYPEAKKALLTAYADTQAAIASINSVSLDYYLMKPWDPPEEHLYPVLDDLLEDWRANVRPPFDGIRVAGTLVSAQSHYVKDFLARNRIPYQWLDVEKDPTARDLVLNVSGAATRLPVVFLPNGTTLVQPHIRDLAAKIGLQTQATQPFYDVIIVGAGPAGLGAGVYAASEGLRVAMIEREATGGQAGTSSRIENYLGFPAGISGVDLAQRASAQARRFGAEILSAQEACSVRVDGPARVVTLIDGTELTCHALVIATGVSVRRLEVPGVDELTGAGVYYGAAATEAVNYRGEHVVVVGGANSAGQGAMFFSRYASKVTILVRGPSVEQGMSQYLVDQIHATDNIEVLTNKEVTGVQGQGRLEAVATRDLATGVEGWLPAAAMFVFIGALPHTDLVAGVVERNPAGFILTGPALMRDGKRPKGWPLDRDPFLVETSAPGVFAVGDVRDGVVRRVASAVGEGAIAISFVHRYLEEVGGATPTAALH